MTNEARRKALRKYYLKNREKILAYRKKYGAEYRRKKREGIKIPSNRVYCLCKICKRKYLKSHRPKKAVTCSKPCAKKYADSLRYGGINYERI